MITSILSSHIREQLMINQIVLDNVDPIKIGESSSKGDQQKWIQGGYWYKADRMGYEGLSEVIVSHLLVKSNVKNFVQYEPVKILYDDQILTGCKSRNFRKKNEAIFTLERLYRMVTGQSFAGYLAKLDSTQEKIKSTVEFVSAVTDIPIKEVGAYLTAMLELDAFFLNEDRHTNNIAIIKDDVDGGFRMSPFFDFGLSLMADTTRDYQLGIDVYEKMEDIEAKPFSISFDEQRETAELLYGDQAKLDFTNADIENEIRQLEGYYSRNILERVRNLLYAQKHKYRYLFG